MLDSGKLELVDCQMMSQHLMSLGASVMPREDFVTRLISACGSGEQQTGWPDNPIRCPDLLRK
jgi:Leu/Phe-tRNA-protein transferase